MEGKEAIGEGEEIEAEGEAAGEVVAVLAVLVVLAVPVACLVMVEGEWVMWS